MASVTNLKPIISKFFCAHTPVVFMVRNRPHHLVNGGGFVVTDSNHKVVFRVDGSGTLGTRGELILRDGDGESLLFIRPKGGIVQALSACKKWKGYMVGFEGNEKLVFTMKEPAAWVAGCSKVRVTVKPKKHKVRDFVIEGSFVERACSMIDRRGNVVAQVVSMEEDDESISIKEIYHVLVQPGFDQAFVFGVIAVLENLNGRIH